MQAAHESRSKYTTRSTYSNEQQKDVMLVRERLCPCSMNLTHFNELVRISTNLCAFHWTWRISGAIHIMTQQTQSISCVSTLKHLRKNFHFKPNFWQSRYFTFAWYFRFLFCLIKAYTSQLSNVCGVVRLSLTLSSDLSQHKMWVAMAQMAEWRLLNRRTGIRILPFLVP